MTRRDARSTSRCAVLALIATASVGCSSPAARPAELPERPAARELVVLVHGMGRTRISMRPLARALEREGYEVLNWGYSSTCCSIAELSAQLRDDLESRAAGFDRVHFVGHSLGTVIIRWSLAHGATRTRVGRVVMLAPPNHGSHEADRLAAWFGWLLKPLPELRTTAASTVRFVPVPPHIPVGVIAGKFDGKVSIAETSLAGSAAHVVVPATHSFLMLRRDVHRLTIEFLHDGRFSPAG